MPPVNVAEPPPREAAVMKPGFARLGAFVGTIRSRILIAFLLMSMITGALGGFAVVGMKRAGVLVEKTYDESLMSINYARAAATDFAAMRAAFARRWITTDPEMRAKLDDTVDALRKTLTDDLEHGAGGCATASAANGE